MPYSTKAGDIMTTNVVTIAPSESVAEAVRLICDRGISGLPVVDGDGKLVGIVSKTDLIAHEYEAQFDRMYEVDLKAIFGSMDMTAAVSTGPGLAGSDQEGARVENIMKRSVVTASCDTSLTEIAGLMQKNNIHRIVIIDGGKVAGIVTSMDLLKFIVEKGTPGGGNA